MFYRKRYKKLKEYCEQLEGFIDGHAKEMRRQFNEIKNLQAEIILTNKKIQPPYKDGDFLNGDKNKVVTDCSFEYIRDNSCCGTHGWVVSYFNKKTNKVETHNII